MQVLEQSYLRLLLSARLNDAPHDVEHLALARFGVDTRGRILRIRNTHEVEQQRQALAQPFIEQQQAPGDTLACGGLAVLLGDAKEGAKQPQYRQKRDRLAVRDAGGFIGHQAARPASLEEFETEPALAESRFSHDADHLRIALPRACERRLQHLHLVATPDEAREPARSRYVQARAHLPEPNQLVHMHCAVQALDLHLAQIVEREVSFNVRCGMRREVDLAGLGDLLHARRETDGVSLRGVVHVQVVADLADDHFTGVEPKAYREVQPAAQAQLIGVGAQPIHKMQRGIAGAARMILVCEGRPEERHDAVAGEFVDEALEALDPIGEDLEKAVHDLRLIFRIELLRQLHRALDVGEEYRDLLAFTFERGARGQDLVGQVFRGVCASRGCSGRLVTTQRGAAFATKTLARRIIRATLGA
jgi:hypothetical protein